MHHGAMVAFIKATEPLLMPGATADEAARVDLAQMEALTKAFYNSWKVHLAPVGLYKILFYFEAFVH